MMQSQKKPEDKVRKEQPTRSKAEDAAYREPGGRTRAPGHERAATDEEYPGRYQNAEQDEEQLRRDEEVRRKGDRDAAKIDR